MDICTILFSFRKRLQPLMPISKKCSHTLVKKGDPTAKPRLSSGSTLLTLLLVLLAHIAQAQTYSLTGGTSANSWPFAASVGGSNKVQWLYYPSNFPTAPAGMITKIYFRTNSTGTYNITDLTLKIGYTTNTTFTSGTYLTGLTTVFSATGTTSVTIPTGGWMGVTLTTPFFYDASQNIVVEASHNGPSTGLTVMQNNSTPNGRIYGNVTATTGTATTGLSDFGFDLLPGPPCATPGAVSVSGITSTAATLSWGAASPSVGYNYIISTSVNPPSTGFSTTTNTSVSASGLIPGTTYYLHVRNNCTNINWSQWVTFQFKTNPPCTARSLSITDITADAAKITWRKESHARQYEYFVKVNKTTPTGTGTITTDSTFTIDQLAEGTKYYVFVKMYCPGGEASEWAIDSFTTRTICRAPSLMINNLSTNQAVVYWQAMPTAVAYEYEISQSPTPLGKGTEIDKTSFYAFPLKDGEAYYFHVRSMCEDQGFISSSEWTTTAFQTFPTSVGQTGPKALTISVSPNPTRDIVTLAVSGRLNNQAKIAITNLGGQILYSCNAAGEQTDIDVKHLPAGIYILRYTDDSYSQTIKLQKQ